MLNGCFASPLTLPAGIQETAVAVDSIFMVVTASFLSFEVCSADPLGSGRHNLLARRRSQKQAGFAFLMSVSDPFLGVSGGGLPTPLQAAGTIAGSTRGRYLAGHESHAAARRPRRVAGLARSVAVGSAEAPLP